MSRTTTYHPLPPLLLLLLLLTTTTATPTLTRFQKDAHTLTTTSNFLPTILHFPGQSLFGGLFGTNTDDDVTATATAMPDTGFGGDTGASDSSGEDVVSVTPSGFGFVSQPVVTPVIESEDVGIVGILVTTTPEVMDGGGGGGGVVEEVSATPEVGVLGGGGKVFGQGRGPKKVSGGRGWNVFGLGKRDGGAGGKGGGDEGGLFGLSGSLGIVVLVAGIAGVVVVMGGVWMVVRRRRLRNSGFEDLRRTGPGVYRAQDGEVGGHVFEIGDERD